MNREEFIKKMKEISPSWKPIEERTPEEQEEAYDRIFDWDDEDEEDTPTEQTP